MPKMTFLLKLAQDDRGTSAVEYGLILSLIVIALLAGLTNLGSQTNGVWGGFTGKASTAMTTPG